MSIYDEMQTLAKSVLKDFKQGVIQLAHRVPAAGPIDEPGEPTEIIYDLDATAKGASYKFVQSGLALATDLMVTAAVVDGVTPSSADFIVIDGVRYKIVQFLPPPAAGTNVVWKFIVRKGA